MTTIKASGRDLELKGDQDIVFYPTDNIWISQGTKLIFEGTVPDNFEAKLQATAVTADRDIILPDSDGTLATQEWVNANGGGSYSNSDVDAHLNQSNPTDGYVLSWTSGDYAWVAQSGGGGGGSLNNIVEDTTPQLGGNLDLNSNDITGTGNVNITGNVTASGTITSSGAGSPTLTSSGDLNLQAGTGATDRVEILQAPFKIASFTTTQRDAKTSENGDFLYNTTTNSVDAYVNGSWASLSSGGGGSSYSNSDVDTHLNTSTATAGQILSWTGTAYDWVADQTGGSTFDQSLNTTDDVEFNSVTTDSIVTATAGTPTITSASNIVLNPTGSVLVQSGGFRLANMDTTARNALTASNGEMIYNTTVNKIQAYQNGAWINLDDGSAA